MMDVHGVVVVASCKETEAKAISPQWLSLLANSLVAKINAYVKVPSERFSCVPSNGARVILDTSRQTQQAGWKAWRQLQLNSQIVD